LLYSELSAYMHACVFISPKTKAKCVRKTIFSQPVVCSLPHFDGVRKYLDIFSKRLKNLIRGKSTDSFWKAENGVGTSLARIPIQ